MKLSIIVSAAGLAGYASGMACPYHLLKRAGLLGADIVEKFDQLKDNPELAERFIQAQNHPGHQKRDTLIGPRDTTGNLDLPLGGGLCKNPPCALYTWRI